MAAIVKEVSKLTARIASLERRVSAQEARSEAASHEEFSQKNFPIYKTMEEYKTGRCPDNMVRIYLTSDIFNIAHFRYPCENIYLYLPIINILAVFRPEM